MKYLKVYSGDLAASKLNVLYNKMHTLTNNIKQNNLMNRYKKPQRKHRSYRHKHIDTHNKVQMIQVDAADVFV